LSLESGYPINTKYYKLDTTNIAKLGLKGNDKVDPKPEADEPKPSLKEANKAKPRSKETDKARPLKEADDPNPRLNGTDKANPKLKEVDEPKLKPKKADKPKHKSKGTGEAKRALEDLENGGDGTKKVAKTSSDANYLHYLQSTVNEYFPDPPKGEYTAKGLLK